MIIFVFLFFEILFGIALPKDNPSDVFSILCVFLNSIAVFIFISKSFKKEYRTILFIAYLLRLTLLFADYYKWFPILHSGADSESLNWNAINIMHYGFHGTFIYTNYGYLTGTIYSLIGPQRLFLQYINVVFGMGTLYYIYRTFQILNISEKTTRLFVFISCLMPQLIIFSGILLRESIIIFSTAISVYYFINLIYNNNFIHFIISICFILLATWLHSGMIGVLFGYLFAIISYNRKSDKIVFFSFRSFIFSFIALFFIILLVKTGVFTQYFNNVLEPNDNDMSNKLYQRVTGAADAGSQYLSWINVNSPTQLLLFSPLKMFYFLFSPIPFNWRGVSDIIGFCLDSVILLYLFYIIISGFKLVKNRIKKNTILFLMIGFLVTTFIYGYGVSAAGTAMRHRTKLFPILIVAAAIVYDYIYNKNFKEKYVT